MKTGSVIIGLIFLVLSAGYVYQSQLLPPSPVMNDVGNGELPTWIGYAGIFLSVLLIAVELRRKRTEEDDEQPLAISGQGLAFLVLVTGFVVAIKLIGYVAAAFVFAVIGIMILERSRRIVLPGLVAVGASAFVYLVFQRLLEVPLPTGAFFGG